MKIDLNKIKIGVSGLGNEIYLYRHGKDPRVALDKRKAEADVMTAVVKHMMADMPKGSTKDVKIDGTWYLITVKPRKPKL